MLAKISVPPGVAVVGDFMRPRLWATAWSLSITGAQRSAGTLRSQLRHLDKLYAFCDSEFGSDALDEAISTRDAAATQLMLDAFFFELTDGPYKTTHVQCWAAACGFVSSIALQRASGNDSWTSLAAYLRAVRRMRRPDTSRFKFVRALPDLTLAALIGVAHPDSASNPFKTPAARLRAWLIVNLLILCGLRRGELLLLAVDALKHDVDQASGAFTYWLNVTTTDEDGDADTRSTRPSIKTDQSHRQVPVSKSLAALYESYVAEARIDSSEHSFLITSRAGDPLSAESVTKTLQRLTAALPAEALKAFRNRTGGKTHVSPHDLRHTCATARYSMFVAVDGNRELALQRMRAFFGWSYTSEMPEVYARAAIQDDLLRTWNDLFDKRIEVLRKGKPHGG